MSKVDNAVNGILNRMHIVSQASDKGSYGEEAVFAICEEIYHKFGGILILSYTYGTEKGLAGNIKGKGKSAYVENLGGHTEIDVLLVTPFRVFPIEVKAYRANTITLTNEGMSGAAYNDKSPVNQQEMHCRHLYPKIFPVLPDGISKYITPLVVFVDKTKVVDKRTPDHKEYIKVTILDQLKSLILSENTPIDGVMLNLKDIEVRLKNYMISSERFLPYIP